MCKDAAKIGRKGKRKVERWSERTRADDRGSRRKFEIIRVARFESERERDPEIPLPLPLPPFPVYVLLRSVPPLFVSPRCSVRLLDSYNFTVGLTLKRLSPPLRLPFALPPRISLSVSPPRPSPLSTAPFEPLLLYIKIRALKTRCATRNQPLRSAVRPLPRLAPLFSVFLFSARSRTSLTLGSRSSRARAFSQLPSLRRDT